MPRSIAPTARGPRWTAMPQPKVAQISLLPAVSLYAQRLQPIALGGDTPPMLQVIVAAEEEFDWSQPFDRDNAAAANLGRQEQTQRIFERYGIRPTYLVDYAVASQEPGYAPLRALLTRDSAEIGALLRPWINPPFDEATERGDPQRCSIPGNLPPGLEHAKLRVLTETIERNLGVRPKIYRAGRHGLGPATFETLEALGYEIDASVLPRIDLRAEGGPDFAKLGPEPFWFGNGRKLLGIPLSAGYTGMLAACHRFLDGFMNRPLIDAMRIKAAAARVGLFDRISLSPEGLTLVEQKRLTRRLLARGQRLFTLSCHSASLLPGATPHVRDRGTLDRFDEQLEAYLIWFVGELGGCFTTPLEIKALLEAR